jgi:hypothetical protein
MKNVKLIMNRIKTSLVVIAILLAIASIRWMAIPAVGLCLLLSCLLIIIAFKLHTKEVHPFVVQKTDYSQDIPLNEEYLIFFHSVKWLRMLHFYEMKIKGNYPISYHFFKYESLPKGRREKLLIEYFKEQL